MIEIKEVSNRKLLKLFAKYPVILYKNCPYYVPSLRSDEMNTFNPKKNFSIKNNPCRGFLCYKDGKVVGRIAALVSREENASSDEKYIRFSRFECVDDEEVFRALLGAVEKFGRENGADFIHGPWGFNDTDREGMLTYGFNERSTYATNYYYPYFHKYMEKLGFSDESKWEERRFSIPDKPYERITEFAERLKKKYNVKDVSDEMSVKEIIKAYGDKWFDTLNDAYGKLDGYIPIEGKAKLNVLKQFATIINPRYFSVVVDENDEVAAFGVVLPSICKSLIKHRGKLFPTGFISVLRSIKKPRELEMALIGIKEKYKNSGINAIVISKIMKNVIKDKIENIESNPMLETNYSILQQWKFADYEVIKRRQTYKKPIGSLL